MSLNKRTILQFLLALLQPVGAQAFPFPMGNSVESNLHAGTLLLEQGAYAAAQACFETHPMPPASYFREAMAYGRAASALARQDGAIEPILRRFLIQYPKSAQADRMRYYLAAHLFESGEPLKSLHAYRSIHRQRLGVRENNGFPYALARVYMALRDWANAKEMLATIREATHPDYEAAQLDLAYIAHAEGDYGRARVLLDRMPKTTRYEAEIRRLTLYVLHRSGAHEDLLDYVRDLPGNPLDDREGQFVADAHFFLQRYAASIPYYRRYLANVDPLDRTTRAKLAHALYQTQEPKEALAHYRLLVEGNDLPAQTAAYYSGLIYERAGEWPLALPCFGQAASRSYDANLQEWASLRQARLLCRQGHWVQAASVLIDFLERHPESSRVSIAQTLLVRSLLATKQYQEAMQRIADLPYKNESLLTLYQHGRFYQGLEAYNQGSLELALDHFKQSMLYPFDPALQIQAEFWMAESFASLGAYQAALKGYLRCLEGSHGLQAEHHAQALYGLAYARFNLGQYAEAAQTFERYLALNPYPSAAAHCDATLRLGDCCYAEKQYDKSLTCYERVYSYHPAHVRYQEALIYEARGEFAHAERCIQEVIERHHKTEYGLKARYREACMCFNQGNYAAAIQKFSLLVEGEPKSPLQPDFRMKRALAFENLHNRALAVADYAAIVDKYPTHAHAESALMALSNLFAAEGTPEKMEPYLRRYRNSMQSADPLSDAEVLEKATTLFYHQAYQQVLHHLHAFAKARAASPLLPQAYFLLAESYYRTQQAKQAARYYRKVTASNQTELHAKAWLRLAALAGQCKQWNEALGAYQNAQKLPLSAKEKNLALVGVMRTSFALQRYPLATKSCLQALNHAPDVSAETIQLARLYLGKLAMQRGAYKDAKHRFGSAHLPQQTPAAAEARFLEAQANFKLKAYAASLDALFFLVEQFPSSPYVDDAFLLMAENYIRLGNLAQAKATLDSIVSRSKQKKTIERAKQMRARVLHQLKKKGAQ